jgi:N-acetylmuramic acid 6-phosphate etherase
MKTESFDERFRGLDRWDDRRILEAIIDGQENALRAVRAALPALENAASLAAARLKKHPQGRLIYAGAGTPARLAVQDGAELTPTYGWPRGRLAFVIAGGEGALLRAVENAEDDAAQAANDMKAQKPGPGDVCICVSASGGTPYTVEACRAARAAGAFTIGIASNGKAALLDAAECPVFIDSGAEPVGGSTRMNAGTAQKAALNMISTLLMIRLGRVYDGLMVDVEMTNAKLRARGVRMLCDITGAAPDRAALALEETQGHVKCAVLVLKGLSVEKAQALLDLHDGDLRAALVTLG